MSKLVNLCGQKFSRLTALYRSNNLHGRVAWDCLCECGKHKTVTSSDLVTGKVKSCGCYRQITAAMTGRNNRKEDVPKRLRRIYGGMISRCNHKHNAAYRNYGARGISVCPDWTRDGGMYSFAAWALSSGYSDEMTIDRIDVNRGYSPGNCRWATMKDQQNNRRNNRIVPYNGENYTLSILSYALGISSATLLGRIRSGWPQEDFSLPPNLNNKNIRRRHIEQR